MLTTKKRIDLVDALRGFAIFGILLLHSIEHFNFYVFPDPAAEPAFLTLLNKHIWDTLFFLFGGKAYGIFALLFGFTFHLQFTKQAQNNIDFGPRFLWRMLLLFGFGWVNAILFPGEILLIYATLSPLLFLARKLNDTLVLVFAILLLMQPVELAHYIAYLLNPDYVLPINQSNALFGQTIDYLKQGSLLAMVAKSYIGFKATFMWSWEQGRLVQTAGLFLLGLFLGRKNMYESTPDSNSRWNKILPISTLLFLTFYLVQTHTQQYSTATFNGSLGVAINAWKNLAMIAMWMSLFTILFRRATFRFIVRPFNYTGRMSLSNYMLQSIVGGALFFPYVFGLGLVLNVTYSFLIGIVLVILQVSFSAWWFAGRKQGPAESLWHKLTWLNSK